MALTKIHGAKQIQDATITDAQIASGAAIDLSKLAEAVIQADGGQAFTGNQSLGGNKLTNLGTPTSSTDAATKGYVDSVSQGLDVKASVRVATTTAGTLATDFENGDTIDGVVLATGDRILIKNQATGSENGIYVVAASGAPARSADADASSEVTAGMFTFVEEGTTNADTGWILTTNGTITLDSTSLTFTKFSSAGNVPEFVDIETPSGTVNGVNTTFSLGYTPVSGSVYLYLNGVLQEGGGNDYTISGSTITMVSAPETGSKLRASYRK